MLISLVSDDQEFVWVGERRLLLNELVFLNSVRPPLLRKLQAKVLDLTFPDVQAINKIGP